MKRAVIVIVTLAVCFCLTGCVVSRHFQEANIGENDGILAENESAIVFSRDYILSYIPLYSLREAPHIAVAEVKDNNVEFVCTLMGRMKFLHKTTPGKHVYLVAGVASKSHILEAELTPQKFYTCG